MKKEIIKRCLKKELLCKDAAKILKMHPKAFSRLKKRFLEKGVMSLMPKKPGPKPGSVSHNRTTERIEDIVVAFAQEHRFLGPDQIADELFEQHNIKLHCTTVWRILKRRGVRYFRDYEPVQKRKPKFYCLDKPGEELQMDGCYPFGRSRRLVAFSAIDDCSRYVFSKNYDRETADNAIRFVEELIKRVPFTIQRIRVDNRYGKKFKQYCEEVLGIEVKQNDPYCSKQNGKVERFNKTLKYDFFWSNCTYLEAMGSIDYKLSQWLCYYNYGRRHTGYGMDKLTPAQKIASTIFFTTSYNYINNDPQKVTLMLQQYKY